MLLLPWWQQSAADCEPVAIARFARRLPLALRMAMPALRQYSCTEGCGGATAKREMQVACAHTTSATNFIVALEEGASPTRALHGRNPLGL